MHCVLKKSHFIFLVMKSSVNAQVNVVGFSTSKKVKTHWFIQTSIKYQWFSSSLCFHLWMYKY